MANTYKSSKNDSSQAQTTHQGQFYSNQYHNTGFAGQSQGMHLNPSYPSWSGMPYGTIPPYSPPAVAMQQQYPSAVGLQPFHQYSTGGGDYGPVGAETYAFSYGMPTPGHPASGGDGLSLNPAPSIGRQQGTGNHTCLECGKSFDRPSQLKDHSVTHTGEKGFGCPHCGQAFGIRSNWTRHIKDQHGEQGKQYLAYLRSEKKFVHQNPGLTMESSSQPGSFRGWTPPMTGPTRDLFTNTTAAHYSSRSSRSRGQGSA